MTQPIGPRRMSVRDYLDFEHDAEEKHEYVDGELIAMAGVSPAASLIGANILRELGNLLDGRPCRAYDSNLKVRIGRRQKYRYPDAMVVCGPDEFDPDDSRQHVLTNPTLIVEVLSPTSERRDRIDKFAEYAEIASFKEYVLVAQDVPTVQTFFRQPDGAWQIDVAQGMDATIQLKSINVTLRLAQVFAKVRFPAGGGITTPDAPPTPPPAGG